MLARQDRTRRRPPNSLDERHTLCAARLKELEKFEWPGSRYQSSKRVAFFRVRFGDAIFVRRGPETGQETGST
jgi:hypothetical protein